MNGFSKYGKFFGVFLILPLIVMAVYVAFVANSEIELKDVTAVEISDERYIHRYTGKKDIEKYVSFILDSKDGAIQEIDESKASYTIEFKMKNGGSKIYYFYPSLDGESIVVDNKGFVRNAADVSSVLARPEYNDVYKPRFLPQISILSMDKTFSVAPSVYSWNYMKTDKEFYPYTDGALNTNTDSFSVSAAMAEKGFVNFSVAPDNLAVVYTYESQKSNKLSDFSLSDGDIFSVSVSARWEQKENSLCYGEGQWKFSCVYEESPVLTLEKTDVALGECIVLYTENVEAGKTLKIETDIITNSSPIIYKGETKNFALVPIGVNTISGSHKMKVSLEDETWEFNIDVSGKQGKFSTQNVDSEIHNTVTSPDGIKEYSDFISSLVSSSVFLWENNKLSAPVNGEEKTGFADIVLYNNVPPQVNFEGISYNVPEKTSVVSAAKGKVIFSGETAKTGKAVVIDHGCGIMTHYYHLSVISAFSGEVIESGKLIGLSGSTGFVQDADMYFAVSINGIFVDPHILF